MLLSFSVSNRIIPSFSIFPVLYVERETKNLHGNSFIHPPEYRPATPAIKLGQHLPLLQRQTHPENPLVFFF